MCRCKANDLNLVYSDTSCPNLYDGECGADCHYCVEAYDSGTKNCHCAPGGIRQVIWGVLLADSLDAGLCGNKCKECRWSWEESDPQESFGKTANYRCRNW